MNINQLVPAENKLLVQVVKEEQVTDSGIIINSVIDYRSRIIGKVKTTNSGEDEKLLDKEILFKKKSTAIHLDDDYEYFIVDKEDILGVFKNGN